MLASKLSERNLLTVDTKVAFYKSIEKSFLKFFRQEDNFVFCHGVKGLLNALGCEWRLFIDSSKASLKCVLLSNGNHYASIPIGHSVTLKESYDTMALVLRKIKYADHNWMICGDLKMICILLGQQSGYAKFPCFLCLWDSRDRENHWIRQNWPKRSNFKVGEKNILHAPLVDPKNVLLPPLHVKLRMMKQFVKALNRESDCFIYLCDTFPALSTEKSRAGIFDGP